MLNSARGQEVKMLFGNARNASMLVRTCQHYILFGKRKEEKRRTSQLVCYYCNRMSECKAFLTKKLMKRRVEFNGSEPVGSDKNALKRTIW